MEKTQQNKITFLGSGGGRVVFSSQIRNFGGFVINIGNHQIHFDPGPGALNSLAKNKLSPSKTDIVFVSHSHIDHANDINAIIDAMTMGGVNESKGILISVPSVIKGTKKDYPWLRKTYKNQLKKIYTLKSGDEIEIDNLKFHATKTFHDDPDCIGAVLNYNKISIGYSSDTSFSKILKQEFKGVKILILNVLRPGKDNWDTHLCTDDAIKIIDEVKPELAILYHFGAKMINANPLYEARRVQRATGVRTVAAEDGMTVSLGGML